MMSSDINTFVNGTTVLPVSVARKERIYLIDCTYHHMGIICLDRIFFNKPSHL